MRRCARVIARMCRPSVDIELARCAAGPALIALFLVMSAVAGPARADWIAANGADRAPNFAEIAVLEDRVRVTLEIDLGDLAAFGFDDPEPRGIDAASDVLRLEQTPEWAFRVEADAMALVPDLVSLQIGPRKDRPVPPRPAGMPPAPPGPPRSVEAVHAVLDYRFQERPARLALAPPLDDRGLPAVTVGFLAEHAGVAVNDYRYLSRAETLVLDWDDPWYTAFENPVLARHHRSAVMGFLSVEPREVRHEVILRLRDLAALTGTGGPAHGPLAAEEAKRVLDLASSVLAGRNSLTIDGQPRVPGSRRAVFLDVGVGGVSLVEDPAGLDRRTALVGVVLSYPHDALPGRVSIDWDVFPDGATQVPVSLSDPAGAVPAIVRPDDRRAVWKNVLRTWRDPVVAPVRVEDPNDRTALALPLTLAAGAALSGLAAARMPARRRRWGSLSALAGVAALVLFAVAPIRLPFTDPTPEPGTATAIAIARGMVLNAAISMLEVQPERYGDAVRVFVAPGAVESVGAELRRGLSVTLPSGALARTEAIRDVAVEEIAPRGDAHALLARWTAEVGGGHWGHLHRRVIRYRALMDVAPRGGAWELRGLTILEARAGT